MTKIFIQSYNPRENDLVIRSNNLTMLEKLKETVEDLFMRCDICKGEVTRSGDQYLCLSGCGHVKGESRTKNGVED